jgi:hypothetical protein
VKLVSKKDQNQALRYFDVAILAALWYVFISFALTFLVLNSATIFTLIGTSICAAIELGVCLVFICLGYNIKKVLKASGEWKKLSRKENFDLHEWKRSNW